MGISKEHQLRGQNSGQTMIETLVMLGVLMGLMVGFGYLVSAFMDHGYRSLVLISMEYP